MKLRDRIRASLFLKIFLLFITAYVLTTFVMMALHMNLVRENLFPKIQRNSVNFCQYIVDDIGNPIDTARAAITMDSLQMNMRIESKEMDWSTDPEVPYFGMSDLPTYDTLTGVRAGFADGLVVELSRGTKRFVFMLERKDEGLLHVAEIHALLLFMLFSLVLLGVYLVIRRMLRPIHVLDHAVHELAKGNLDHEITTQRKDELGDLISSVNMMACRLRTMLQARDRLLLDVSHELRSPLTRMKITMEFLEDEKLRGNLSDDIQQMETMLTEILETERLKSTHGDLLRKSVNVADLLRDATDEFEGSKPGITLVDLPIEQPMHGDADRLRILFRNILGNAIKYSPDDGPAVEVSLQASADTFTIKVQDFGSGIPDHELPFIFEPFYRVDKARSHDTGGYGLGLALCKTITEHHDGRIEIVSNQGKGATVYMTFPF